MRGWVDFLEDEAEHAHWLAGDFHWIAESPYWTNPILTQGKLGAVRGSFYDDPLDTNLHIGTIPSGLWLERAVNSTSCLPSD